MGFMKNWFSDKEKIKQEELKKKEEDFKKKLQSLDDVLSNYQRQENQSGLYDMFSDSDDFDFDKAVEEYKRHH